MFFIIEHNDLPPQNEGFNYSIHLFALILHQLVIHVSIWLDMIFQIIQRKEY